MKNKTTKLILISDTHGKHPEIQLPPGDILVHGGDFTGRGTIPEVQAFLSWFVAQPHPQKVFIAGNHDWLLENEPHFLDEFLKNHPDLHYLNDSGCLVNGLHFWGSPVSPTFFDWAFNRDRGEPIKRHWDLIPPETQVLITHGPPYGILDRTARGLDVGCQDLLDKLPSLPKLKVHVFGHIHEGYGIQVKGGVTHVNACSLDERYRYVNAPVVMEV